MYNNYNQYIGNKLNEYEQRINTMNNNSNQSNQFNPMPNYNPLVEAKSKLASMVKNYENGDFEEMAIRYILLALNEYKMYNYSMPIPEFNEMNDLYRNLENRINELNNEMKEGAENVNERKDNRTNENKPSGNGGTSSENL